VILTCVPCSSVLRVLVLFRSEAELNQGGPILTHGSTGVGRPGTIIALDFACQLLEANGKVE
jgi:protein tyrosine phosphatase